MRVYPGTVVALLVVAVAAMPGAARAQCDMGGGTPVGQGCQAAGITWEGCCDTQELYWCEGGWICYLNCAPDNLSCGWRADSSFYACDTAGAAAPGNNPPMECPAQGPVDADGDGYDEDSDCNDGNPNVHPGATENCTNGVDDDCDGYVDSWDADCSGDDDDSTPGDDDTTPGDDDDTTPGDDDDTTPGDDDTGPADDDDDAAADDDDDDAADDDDDDDDDFELSGDAGLGIQCVCRAGGPDPAGAFADLALLAGLILVRRR